MLTQYRTLRGIKWLCEECRPDKPKPVQTLSDAELARVASDEETRAAQAEVEDILDYDVNDDAIPDKP